VKRCELQDWLDDEKLELLLEELLELLDDEELLDDDELEELDEEELLLDDEELLELLDELLELLDDEELDELELLLSLLPEELVSEQHDRELAAPAHEHMGLSAIVIMPTFDVPNILPIWTQAVAQNGLQLIICGCHSGVSPPAGHW
jgi:hypothetical protein